MSLLFTLRGVDTKKGSTLKRTTVPTTERLIKSTKTLVIKAPNEKHSFFERSNIRGTLKTRFNEVLTTKQGEEYPIECQYPCDWCRKHFESPPIGIPLNYKIGSDGIFRYQCDGYCCSFECALAVIRSDNSAYARGRDPLYRDAEPLLKNVYAKLYPDKKLVPALDWRLMRNNGGDITQSEEHHHSQYVRTCNLKMVPIGVTYQQC